MNAEHTSTLAHLPRVQRISAVLWPAFLCAGAATVVFFALIDPLTLLECRGDLPLSRTGAYSLGFFLFWLLTITSSLATLYFLNTRVPASKHVDEPARE